MSERTLIYVTDLSFDTTPYTLEQLGGDGEIATTQQMFNGLEGIVRSLRNLSERARQWCQAACPWEYSAHELAAVKRQIDAEQSRYDKLQREAEARIATLAQTEQVNASIAAVLQDTEARAAATAAQAVRQRLLKVREFARAAYETALPYFRDFEGSL